MNRQVPFIWTRCGYCLGLLAPVEHGSAIDFECPRCAPELAKIVTTEQWVEFHHRTSREVARQSARRSPSAGAGDRKSGDA